MITWLKRCLAQTMQWMGSLGVFLIVDINIKEMEHDSAYL